MTGKTCPRITQIDANEATGQKSDFARSALECGASAPLFNCVYSRYSRGNHNLGVDPPESARRLSQRLTAHLNSLRAARICAIGNEPIEKTRSLPGPRSVEVTLNETWKIYSHDRGHPFVDHVTLRSRHSFQGGTGKNKVQQKI
ncbi:MAG: hypothetical protein DME90_08825 [Verrucomicrobia bacterium]|nr:MAG: hypothetical protein DME90_08825 [Verrucomicrobiota bacterium]